MPTVTACRSDHIGPQKELAGGTMARHGRSKMRRFLLVVLAACSPKVAPAPPQQFDEDFERRQTAAEPAELPDDRRAVAPPGKGLRSGTIRRDRLIAVLDAGPARFLRQFEVTPRMKGQRFVGWQLVQLLDRHSPLYDVDLVPGDVLLAVNGNPVSRPDQLQSTWDALRTANALTAQLWRGDAKLTLEFTIEPAVGAVPSVTPAAPPTGLRPQAAKPPSGK
jgi:hypothetical protein